MVSPSPESLGKRHLLREDLNIEAILRVLWFYKGILLTVTFVTGVASLVYFSSQEKTYEAISLIKINDIKTTIVELGDQFENDLDVPETIENDVVYLTSSLFLRKIVDLLDLSSDPEFSTGFDVASIGAIESMKVPPLPTQEPSSEAGLTWDDGLAQIVDQLRDHVEVNHVGNSHVISVRVLSASPKKAAQIANAIAETYVSDQLVSMEGTAHEAISLLEERITRLRGELAGIEGQMINYKASNGLEYAEDDSSIDVQRSELATQLVLARTDRARAVGIHNFTKARIEGDGALTASRTMPSLTMSELSSIEVGIMRRLSELSSEYGIRHPVMVSLQRDLASVHQQMVEEAHRVLHEEKSNVAVSLAREAEIEAHLAILDAKATGEQRASIELDDLQRNATASKDLLQTFLTRHSELLEQVQVFESDAEIMSPAAIPLKHKHPKPLLFSIIFALGGFCLASMGAFLGERWVSDFGFKTLEELKDFDLEPLGIVPDLRRGESKGCPVEDYILTHPQSAQAEAFQHIRTRLYQLDLAAQSVMVTSSLPLEGKTTTAITLARQAAEAGLRTLLIDADLRRPRAHDVLDVELGEGLSDLLTAPSSPAEVIVEDRLTPLHFLSAGLQERIPPDLFRTKRMSALVSSLKRSYDWIIIDTPPIGAVSDCLSIGQYVEHCVYVARWRSTQRNVVLSGTLQIKEAGIELAGIILSRVNTAEQRKYGNVDFGQHYGHYHDRRLPEVA